MVEHKCNWCGSSVYYEGGFPYRILRTNGCGGERLMCQKCMDKLECPVDGEILPLIESAENLILLLKWLWGDPADWEVVQRFAVNCVTLEINELRAAPGPSVEVSREINECLDAIENCITPSTTFCKTALGYLKRLRVVLTNSKQPCGTCGGSKSVPDSNFDGEPIPCPDCSTEG